jgi:anti-sigma regulatory factor (Ser/Thr protein kinase)
MNEQLYEKRIVTGSAHMEGGSGDSPLAKTRDTVERALAVSGVPMDQIQDVLICVNEACTNAILHAGAGESSAEPVRVSWELRGDILTVRVQDSGPGFRVRVADLAWPPQSWERGRGLFIISQLSDGMLVNAMPRGTELVFRKVIFRRPEREGSRVA